MTRDETRMTSGLLIATELAYRRGEVVAFCCLALRAMLVVAAGPASDLQQTEPQAALYSTVSIYPPDAKSMTVCYGFVCRRREILAFTAGGRAALTKIVSCGRASAAAGRAAVQKAVLRFDRRMGPVIGTDERAPHEA